MKKLISLLITFAFLGFFFYFVPLREIFNSLKSVSPGDFFLGFLLYTLSQITRSLRWSLLLRIPFKVSFFLNSANLFWNNFLPARSGELSWFYYTKKLGIELMFSLWSFVIGRAYDLMGLISTVFLIFSYINWGFYLTIIFFLLFSFVYYLLPFIVYLVPERFSNLREFLQKEFSPSLSIKLFFLSLVSFVLKATATYLVVKNIWSFGFLAYTFGFLGGELSSVLPVHGFMGYGSYEFAFGLPVKLYGIEMKEALKAGFIAHNFLLLSSAFWGVLSIFYLQVFSRKFP
ncbi:YbhN family protein [Aquifex pyrophilus]